MSETPAGTARHAGRWRGRAFLAGAVLLLAGCVTIPPLPASSPMPRGSFNLAGGHWTTFPAGYDRGIVELTQARWVELVTVQVEVDRQITYASDKEAHGVTEYWGLPARGKGDCEDIALEKASRLLLLGWPRNALRMAVVHAHGRGYTQQGMHAVLTVETDRGVYVLDRLEGGAPIPWTSGPYDWVARERPEGGVVSWEFFINRTQGNPPPPSCG